MGEARPMPSRPLPHFRWIPRAMALGSLDSLTAFRKTLHPLSSWREIHPWMNPPLLWNPQPWCMPSPEITPFMVGLEVLAPSTGNQRMHEWGNSQHTQTNQDLL